MVFLELRRETGIYSLVTAGMVLQNSCFLSDISCLVTTDTSGISSRLGRAIGLLSEVRRETQCPYSVATGILGFLSIL